ncbi:MAG: nicotinamide riboside transporter PnuC [Anaerovoracaceae bacterium]
MNLIKSLKNLSKFETCLWLGSVAVIIAASLSMRNGSWLNLVSSLIGVTSLILVAKGDALGQLLMVIFSICYAVISWHFRYYGEMITYLGMTMPIAAAAMVSWLRHPYKEREVRISRMHRRNWIILLSLTAAVTAVFYFLLAALATPNLFFSTVSITTSFLAASLMLLRSRLYAVAYASNDLVLIILWVLATLENMAYLPMIICFAVFFVKDMYGFYNWGIMRRRQEEKPSA